MSMRLGCQSVSQWTLAAGPQQHHARSRDTGEPHSCPQRLKCSWAVPGRTQGHQFQQLVAQGSGKAELAFKGRATWIKDQRRKVRTP